jgi:hypothetical protein
MAVQDLSLETIEDFLAQKRIAVVERCRPSPAWVVL